MSTATVHLDADVSGTLGGSDGPVDFELTAGDHDVADIDADVLAYLLEFGLAAVAKKRSAS